MRKQKIWLLGAIVGLFAIAFLVGRTSIHAAAPVKLVFTTPVRTTTTGTPTGVMTIQMQDSGGSPATSLTPVILNLSSSGGSIYLTPTCVGPSISLTTIVTGTSSANIYFCSSTAGDFNVNVTATGLTGSSQVVHVNAPDISPPNTTIISPAAADYATDNLFSEYSGKVVDNDSGPASVTISIKRNSDGLYWTGVAWLSPIEVNLNTTLNGSNWRYAMSASDLQTISSYTIRVAGRDNAGNQETTGTSLTFNVVAPDTGGGDNGGGGDTGNSGGGDNPTDTTPPKVGITYPYKTPTNIIAPLRGIAADEDGGSGLQRVDVSLLDTDTGKYYDGNDFTKSTDNYILAAGLDDWLVQMYNLTSGHQYRAKAKATDQAGNVSSEAIYEFVADLDAPASFDLLSPAAGQKLENRDVKFAWQTSSDSTTSVDKYTLYVDDKEAGSTSGHELTYTAETGDHQWYVIAYDAAGNGTGSQTRSFTISNTPANVINDLPNKIINTIKDVPEPVQRAVPYTLFLVLAVMSLGMIVMTKLEIGASIRHKEMIRKNNELGVAKQSYLTLSSHYLRTPISVINMTSETLFDAQTVPKHTQHLIARKVKALQDIAKKLTDRDKKISTKKPPLDDADTKDGPIYKSPYVIGSIAGVGLNAIAANFVFIRYGQLDFSVIEAATQVLMFGALAEMFMIIARYRRVRRRELHLEKAQLRFEEDIEDARNSFIGDTGKEIGEAIHGLGAEVEKLDIKDKTMKHDLLKGIQDLEHMAGDFGLIANMKLNRYSRLSGRINVKSAIAEIVKDKSDLIKAKKLKVSLPAGLEISSDPPLIRVVMEDIIDNAIKFSKEKGHVGVEAVDSGGKYYIKIVDHGVGVGADKKNFIFQPFVRAGEEDIKSFNFPGMGFSLYKDRVIMQYLGGELRFESTAGKGTTVTIIVAKPRKSSFDIKHLLTILRNELELLHAKA